MPNLKTYRLQAGLTQEQLSQKSGVSRVTIALLESVKQTEVKSSTILKLTGALKYDNIMTDLITLIYLQHWTI